MGEILAFSPRPPASDWSANERGLLMLLTQQLESSYGEVDGVFGQTDSGDPWYVVTDSNQEVLVHIARIDGQFVVHDAAIDMFHQVGSLWSALRQVLASGVEDQGGVVVAFNPSSREAQSFLSLVIAVGLYLELRGIDLGEAGRLNFENLPRADDPAIDSVASKLIAALNLEADRVQSHAGLPAVVAAAPTSDTPIKPESGKAVVVEIPAEGQPGIAVPKIIHLSQAEAPVSASQGATEGLPDQPAKPGADDNGFAGGKYVMNGTAGDDVLKGGVGADTIHGGAGDDYIDGGGVGGGNLAAAGSGLAGSGGGIDRLDGGAGNDHIVMNARVVASGGPGADTFLLSATPPTEKLEALLGVVLDFSAAKGDHLAVLGKGQMTVVSTASVNDVLAVQSTTLGEAVAPQVTDVTHTIAGARVGFDINGDGREDVFILLGGATATTFRVGTTIANDHGAAAASPDVPLIGQSSTDLGHFVDPTTPAR
ncbi:calcium-binding protein [Caulobacter sp. 1776]|uniref:calcium-binding protein n=1 Tax=Caulobacter sp. 1776 TaxID=3156420 RepID=UPI0033911DDC